LAQARKLEGLQVLIVDDEALVAIQLEDMLAELGCAIVGPANRVGHSAPYRCQPILQKLFLQSDLRNAMLASLTALS
jgi:AmiR/NasT family two-component response regulator